METIAPMIGINTILDWGQFATFIGALAAVATGITVIYKLIIMPIKNFLSKIIALSVTINRIAEEFNPNGGSSLKDAITRIELGISFSNSMENTLATMLGIAMWRSDKDGKYIWASSKLCEIYDLNQDDMNGTGWINGVAEEDREQVVESWELAVKEKRRYENSYTLTSGVKVHASGSRVLDVRGNLLGYIGTIRNVLPNGSLVSPLFHGTPTNLQ